MITLYYAPETRGARPRWILEELGVPYELRRLDVDRGENKSPTYLQIHPLGRIPALIDGEVQMFESAAIVMYLADKYIDRGLAPPLGSPLRAAYYQWMFFAMNELDPWLARMVEHTRFIPEAQRNPALVAEARERVGVNAMALEQALQDRPYILGDQFSACDIVLAGTLRFEDLVDVLSARPGLKAYIERTTSRPACQRAMAD